MHEGLVAGIIPQLSNGLSNFPFIKKLYYLSTWPNPNLSGSRSPSGLNPKLGHIKLVFNLTLTHMLENHISYNWMLEKMNLLVEIQFGIFIILAIHSFVKKLFISYPWMMIKDEYSFCGHSSTSDCLKLLSWSPIQIKLEL